MEKRWSLLLLIIIISVFIFSVQGITNTEKPSEIIDQAIEVLKEMEEAEDSGAFAVLLGKAKGVAIFPSLTRIGLGIGGQFGKGIIFRKGSAGIWYGPAFIEIKSLSLGPQMGIQSVALVLVISNERGMEGFLENNLTLGGNISIAVGPLGRSLSADTDLKMEAAIYSYSIAKGAYVGASFQGSTIAEDKEMNKLFYGKEISHKNILENKISLNPDVLKLLLYLRKLGK
ncbi:MAG: lipid-binding SYLF domain-containing protein [Candidatus Caldatribacteriota bacterium]